jgi:hypothetical protein
LLKFKNFNFRNSVVSILLLSMGKILTFENILKRKRKTRIRFKFDIANKNLKNYENFSLTIKNDGFENNDFD